MRRCKFSRIESSAIPHLVQVTVHIKGKTHFLCAVLPQPVHLVLIFIFDNNQHLNIKKRASIWLWFILTKLYKLFFDKCSIDCFVFTKTYIA